MPFASFEGEEKFGQKPVEVKPRGHVEDGGHVILSCPNCKRDLVDIFITRPNEKLGRKPLIQKVRALCGFCGDKSYTQTIEGGFHHSCIKGCHKDGVTEINLTKFKRIDVVDGVVVFDVIKGDE